MEGARNPELQRLLDSLSSYAPQTQERNGSATANSTSTSSNAASTSVSHSQVSAIPGLGFLPPEPLSRLSTTSPSSAPPAKSPDSRTSTPTSTVNKSLQPAPSAPIPDASMITTWPAALKHVTKHLAPNEAFANRIRHLIATQHQHEEQWHDGRNAVISMQSSRSSTSAQVSALLNSIGGKTVEAKANDSTSNEKELEAYDKKVYAGLMAMAADFDRQLRGLGVPFYAIKHELVILEEGKEMAGAMKGRIDKGELRELQKRMLVLLEDLFGG